MHASLISILIFIFGFAFGQIFTAPISSYQNFYDIKLFGILDLISRTFFMVYIALFIVTSVNNNFKNKDMVSSLFDLAATSLERSYQKYHDYVKQPNDDNYINLMMEIKNLSRNIDYLHKAITSKKITTNDCAPDEIKRQYLAYKKETTDLPTSRKAQQTGILTCNASVMYSNLHRELILNKLRLYS